MRLLPGRLSDSPTSRLLAGVLVGVLFGRFMSLLPAPSDSRIFWVGNLCAPWLLIAFCAGRAQRTALRAVIAGVLSECACVVGFYAHFLLLGPTALGLDRDTPLQSYVLDDVVQWLQFISFWLTVAVGSGILYGLLGHWWKRSAPLAVALAVGLPFVAEPGLWTLRLRQFQGPWGLWVTEVAVGVAISAALVVQSAHLRVGRSET